MSTDASGEHQSGSTTWVWKRVKMERRPQGPSNTAARRASSPPLAARSPREPLTVTVVYRGGPECWWEVRGRGRVYRVPGHVALHDLMRLILERPDL